MNKNKKHTIYAGRCIDCHQNYWLVADKPCQPTSIPDRVQEDATTGRALPGHPGLA